MRLITIANCLPSVDNQYRIRQHPWSKGNRKGVKCMKTKVTVTLNDYEMKKLQLVAEMYGKNVSAVAKLGVQLYLDRFIDFVLEELEDEKERSSIVH